MGETQSPPPEDRWQQLISTFDPERNMAAIVELLQNAASTSQEVLGSMMGSMSGAGTNGSGATASGTQDSTASLGSANPWAPNGYGLREAMAEMERSMARVYDFAGSFVGDMPWMSNGAAARDRPEIVVIDGIGTTLVELAVETGGVLPRATELESHDRNRIGASAVKVIRSQSLGPQRPAFVVRVQVPSSTAAGVYHGQLLIDGLPEAATAILVRVLDPEPTEPIEPTVSAEPTESTVSAEPTVSTEPIEPTEPTVSAEPTVSTEPTEPIEPTGSPGPSGPA